MCSRRPLDPCGFRRPFRLENVDRGESLVREGRHGSTKLPKLTAHGVGRHGPMSASAESLQADLERNVQHDGHDCPGGGLSCDDAARLAAADKWLQANIAPLLASPTFQKDGLLVIVFDESFDLDLANGGGHVPLLVISPRAKPGYQSSTLFQHQSTLRMLMEAAGAKTLPGASAFAPDMGEFFR